MVTDRVGDFIIRLQNAAMTSKREVLVPHSLHLEAVARKLKQLGFIAEIETKSVEGSPKKTLKVVLAFDEHGNPIIRGVKRLSKPGRRLYVSHTEAHRVAGGMGARLISTSAGVLSDAEARKKRAGGETLFEIW